MATKKAFVAFAARDPLLIETITESCRQASNAFYEFLPWNKLDASGQPIDASVVSWLEEADFLIADVSVVNENVTFEIGVAIGMGKPVRLIRYAHSNWDDVVAVGLLHNLGHDVYRTGSELVRTLGSGEPPIKGWPSVRKNYAAPIYFVQPSTTDSAFVSLFSALKKRLHLRFRNFNPREVDRLTASEAYAQVMSSFGIVATWHSESASHAQRQNQRAAFVIGLAKGADLPFRLVATDEQRLPLDLDEVATRWNGQIDIALVIASLKEEVEIVSAEYGQDVRSEEGLLSQIHCGDPSAENEMAALGDYFLETEEYVATLEGESNVLIGRKGSGKTAIFVRTRDKIRSNRNNIVIDLQPEGYQLIKLKEFVLNKLTHGSKKEFLAAFWEYIVWLEIAYKILEKDALRAERDSSLLVRYDRLQEQFNARVDTGSGDFSERLQRLTDRIVDRFEKLSAGQSALESSKSLEIVYGSEIRKMRDEIFSYLKLKGVVCFLFDNLDRIWTRGGFGEQDATIIGGLIESLQEIERRFAREEIFFQWAVFIRSDVFELVVKQMADYGKLAVKSVEWNDQELLWRMFKKRALHGLENPPDDWEEFWNTISVPVVRGKPAKEFLLDSCLMRPRYLIRLFETARARAVMFERNVIEEADYDKALEELGWQVLEDFDRELADIVPSAEELLFDLSKLGKQASLDDLKAAIRAKVESEELVEAVIDTLIWTGSIGVANSRGVTYISDAGYKRPFMRALLAREKGPAVIFHPTLATIFG